MNMHTTGGARVISITSRKNYPGTFNFIPYLMPDMFVRGQTCPLDLCLHIGGRRKQRM
jgi:hypothetical protein